MAPVSPQRTCVLSTMKESDPKNSEDLDAGWDTDGLDAGGDAGAQTASSVSAKQTKPSVPAVVDDIDAGWDADAPAAPPSHTPPKVAPVPKIQLSLSRVDGPAPASEKPTPNLVAAPKQAVATKKPAAGEKKVVAAPVAPPAIAANPPTRKLTKKERREIERQQRAHAVQKKTETKQQRKHERTAAAVQTQARQQLAAGEPASPSVKPQGTGKVKARRKSKPRRAQRPVTPPKLQAAPPTPRALGRKSTEIEPNSTERTSSLDGSKRQSKSTKSQSRMALWTLGIVVLVLALLFIFQKK